MVITDIVSSGKTKKLILIDDEVAFALYGSDLRCYHLEPNMTVDESMLEKIYEETLYKRAKLRTMNLLKEKAYTEYQLREKLRKGYYPEKVIDVALDYVKGYRYVDDLQYARDYIADHMDKMSNRGMCMKLMSRGISAECYKRAFSEVTEENPQDEGEQIRALLAKKRYCVQTADSAEKKRVAAFLLRRGYSYSEIRRQMALSAEEMEGE